MLLAWLQICSTNIKIKKLLPNESSFDILSLFDYFFVKNVSTSSGDMIASWKVYAPVFGDLTILIALVNLFDAVCNVATVFFAMTYIVLLETFCIKISKLFNLFMNSHSL